MKRLNIHQIDTTGATDGDGPVYDAASGRVIWASASGGIQSIIAGSNVTVDDTDPLNPVITAAGGGVYPADVDKGIKYGTIDITGYKAQSDAAARLTLPVTGSEATHPSVLHFPDGWNGYRYWMAFTPYPGGNDAFEDPYVVASQDGTTWETPAGLTNPLDDAPGGTRYNSDTELAVSPDGLTLYLIWRQHNDAATGAEEIIYVRSTTDGTTWTAKASVLTANKTTELLASPAVLHDGTQWVMWTVDIVANPNVIRRRTASAITGPWSAATACTVTGLPSGRDLWHLSVLKLGAQYVALLNDCTLGVNGSDGELYLMRSTDGLAWTMGDPLLSQVLPGEHDSLYRGSLVPTFVNGRLEFDMWHGGWMSGSFVNYIYRHRLAVQASSAGSGLTVQDENGTIATGVTQLDFQGATVAATDGSGEVVVTVTAAASSSGHWEVVMAPGTSSPPVPLETPDGTDWLYVEV